MSSVPASQHTGPFMWAAGIEDTFIPQARPGLRPLEEYLLTQHYELWQSDFELVASTGVQYVRWGIPWYQVQPAPDRWDWSWTDAALEHLVNRLHITPILDLMHYGTPLWLENSFLNSAYPERVAEYACQVARRYRGLVRFYTPLNEPSVNAIFCGENGQWPPYLTGHDGFVKILMALARGICLTVPALQAEQPELTTVQVEALWHNWTRSTDPAHQAQVALGNARQYLSFDLCTGRVDEQHPLYGYLREHGVTPADLDWFREHRVSFDIFGANFYPWSYGELAPRRNGRLAGVPGSTPGSAIAEVIRAVYERYGLPVMVTETSANREMDGRARWMDETIAAVRSLRQEGVPVVGYTWFPLFTMIDWKYRTGNRPLRDYLLNLGLIEADFDEEGVLRRHPTPLVARYQQHMAQPMPPVGAPSGEG